MFPDHLRHYMPDYMDVGAMHPDVLWETDATRLELAKAVQAAWREGTETAKQGHDAEQAMQQRAAQLRQGRTAC